MNPSVLNLQKNNKYFNKKEERYIGADCQTTAFRIYFVCSQEVLKSKR